jgi:hypothetical protein
MKSGTAQFGVDDEPDGLTDRNKYVDCQGENCVNGFAFGTVH